MTTRYTSRAFPSYAYIPGRTPHPVRNSQGHSYGQREAPLIVTRPEDWKTTDAYLFGVDLYNHAFYWEAHEAWEQLWKPLNHESPHSKFLQGLIQLAAAQLKKIDHRQDAYEYLLAAAKEKLRFSQIHFGSSFMGLDMRQFLLELDAGAVERITLAV